MYDTFYYGWMDGYRNWVFYAKRADNEEGHLDIYWKGVDAGMKYAQEHVMVRVVQGHVLADYSADRIRPWMVRRCEFSCAWRTISSKVISTLWIR